MKTGVVLSVHENSETYRDTLESVKHYLSKDVMLIVDGFGWDHFQDEEIDKVEGFRHGKPAAPVRNMTLGLMEAWSKWGSDVDWYCYMEYDCLIGSSDVLNHLRSAEDMGYWMIGNNLRRSEISHLSMPFLDRIEGGRVELYYLLGCCCFLNVKFMRALNERNFFDKLLNFTNFFPSEFSVFDGRKNVPAHDPSEFIYPSLAVHYGGSVQQFANGDQSGRWGGNFGLYPMRFTPELGERDPFQGACIMHPVKDARSPIRLFHRNKRLASSAF